VRPAEFKAYLTESGWAKKLSADAVPKTLTCQRNYLVTAAPEHLAYDAAIACGFLTRCLLNAGETLSLETVLSHPSKVDILSAASDMGYKCYVYYICTQDVQINIDRVANRVRKGGHDVPRSKIRSRFAKSLSLLPEVIRTAYRAFLFDNSGSGAGSQGRVQERSS